MNQDSWQFSLPGNVPRAEGEQDGHCSCPQKIQSLTAISVPYHSSYDNYFDGKLFYYNTVVNILLKMVFLH